MRPSSTTAGSSPRAARTRSSPRTTPPSSSWSAEQPRDRFSSAQKAPDPLGQLAQGLGRVALEPYPLRRQAVVAQGQQVAVGLGVLQLAEAEVLARHVQVLLAVVGELEEEPGRRAALVELARRVEEARPVAERGRGLGRIADDRA